MFELNPLANPDALWQHILMLVVAAVLGYIIGHVSGSKVVTDLESRLDKLDIDLENCKTKKMSFQKVPAPVQTRTVMPVIEQVAESVTASDLKVIEGIGPQIEILLNEKSIKSFDQLKNTSPEQLLEILRNGGPQFQMHDPTTWPRQAGLASEERWEELKTWQDELNKGRLE